MKIVQTYWSKPIFQKSKDLYNRIQGGWPSMQHALSAIGYSCLSIKKYYPNLEIITDKKGAAFLIDSLELPYQNVNIALEDFNVNSNLWALAKVYSYSLQEEPFIHIDNDIFIWDKFPERIEKSKLCCQNKELLTPDYQTALFFMQNKFKEIPLLFQKLIKNMDNCDQFSINAGILGGNDVDFLNTYAKTVLDCYQKYINDFLSAGSKVGLFNIVLEQLTFGILSRNKEVEFLIAENLQFDEIINKLINIYTAPIETKFVHCLGEVKKYLALAQQIEMRLRYEYPTFYNRVLKFCIQNGYPISFNKEYSRNVCTYKIISQFTNASHFMRKVHFRLKRNVRFYNEDGKLYLDHNNHIQEVSGWGKILLLMDSFIAGEEITQILSKQLIGIFSEEYIRDNVMSYLIQCLYSNELVEIKVK